MQFTKKEAGTFLNEALGPDEDAIKAMITTFRPFIRQDLSLSGLLPAFVMI